jgi:hypothetical protein
MTTFTKKLTMTFGEVATPEWRNAVDADIQTWISADRMESVGPYTARWTPLDGDGYGGTRYFLDQASAEEWAALTRTRATTITRTIISQIIADA